MSIVMASLAALVLSSGEPASTWRASEDLPPAMILAVELAESVGTTIEVLKLEANAEFPATDRTALEKALEKTGVFAINPAAPHTLNVHRISDDMVMASVEDQQSNRLWIGHVRWPADGVVEKRQEHVANLKKYENERLEIGSLTQTTWTSPVGPYRYSSSFRTGGHLGPESREPNVHPLVYPTAIESWAILRGDGQTIDDMDLARMLDNSVLANKIAETRKKSRLLWGAGFGAASLVGLGTGTWLWTSPPGDANLRVEQNWQTLGISLITMGVATGIAALFYGNADNEHVLNREAAQQYCEQYNESLRTSLGLTPDGNPTEH